MRAEEERGKGIKRGDCIYSTLSQLSCSIRQALLLFFSFSFIFIISHARAAKRIISWINLPCLSLAWNRGIGALSFYLLLSCLLIWWVGEEEVEKGGGGCIVCILLYLLI